MQTLDAVKRIYQVLCLVGSNGERVKESILSERLVVAVVDDDDDDDDDDECFV